MIRIHSQTQLTIEGFESPFEGGWLGGQATDRMMEMSWMLATIAGWSVILAMDELYELLAKSAKAQYPKVCIQLWHPEQDLYQYLYP